MSTLEGQLNERSYFGAICHREAHIL